MSFKNFLKEDIGELDQNYTYQGSENDIQMYYKNKDTYEKIVGKRDETELNNMKRVMSDLVSSMNTKQEVYQINIDRLV